MKGQFYSALDLAVKELRKYTTKHLHYVSQVHVFDLRQLASLEAEVGMGKTICKYTEVFWVADLDPAWKAEWATYWNHDRVQNIDGFNIPEWWES